MSFGKFGSHGVDCMSCPKLRLSDLRWTRHALERVGERLNTLDPLKELKSLLNEGVLITDRQSLFRITNGRYTLLCAMEGCLLVAVTFRHANTLEKRASYRRARKTLISSNKPTLEEVVN